MEDIDRVGQSSGVDDAVRAAVVPHTDLLDALANRRHGLEVVGLQSMLHTIQLVPSIPLRVIREFPQAMQGISKELDRLTGISISVLI